MITIDQLGYSKTLIKDSLFSPLQELYDQIPTTLKSVATGVSTTIIRSGDMTGNLNIIGGYLKSNNYFPGINGWKFDALGNLEANTAVIRGSPDAVDVDRDAAMKLVAEAKGV